jgi:hypothetical protein
MSALPVRITALSYLFLFYDYSYNKILKISAKFNVPLLHIIIFF